MTATQYDDKILYARKSIVARTRHCLYRIVGQGLGWVRVQQNDGMAIPGVATIDVEQFVAEFEATTETA